MEHEHDYDPTDYEGEIYAEFVMSWVSGGGSASDAPQAWRQSLGEEPVPYYMDMTPEEREADNIRFEMMMEMGD